MENLEINNESQGDTALSTKKYNINEENVSYTLQIEIYDKTIKFMIFLTNNIEYNFEAIWEFSSLAKELQIYEEAYSGVKEKEKFFDMIYEKKDFKINLSNDESCILKLKFLNVLNIKECEIKLEKNFFKSKYKYNALLNQIKILKENDINELNKKIDKKDLEIKELIDKKDLEIKETINKKDLEIKEIINTKNLEIKDSINKNKEETLEIINKKDLEIKTIINKKDEEIREIINKKDLEIKDIINKKNEEIKDIIGNKTSEIISIINKGDITINELKEKIQILETKISKLNNHMINMAKAVKNNENVQGQIILKTNNIENTNQSLKNKIDILKKDFDDTKNLTHDLVYEKKINYEFISDPKHLKLKKDIKYKNTSLGCNDIFEIFVSYKDNKEYLVSSNFENKNLNIIDLKENKIIKYLSGHKAQITTIRYFMNNKNNNEYLISGGIDKLVILWDITNDYKSIKIETKYLDAIYSCLLVFPKINEGYLITSTYFVSENVNNSATKIYNIYNLKNEINYKYIENSNNYSVFYLLSWYNNKDNNYYIIQFSFEKLIVSNLLNGSLYNEFNTGNQTDYRSGIIYNIKNIDYLFASSVNGFIYIYDLYQKNLYGTINCNTQNLGHMIKWNTKYIIVADLHNNSFIIIDIEDINTNVNNNDKIKCGTNLISIKKIKHPLYGESLFIAGNDNIIRLWSIVKNI